MLELSSHNEPNILFEGEEKKSFKIFTIATNEERHYRITKENSLGFFQYDFLVNLGDFQNGDPFIIEIPYFMSNFVDSRLPQGPPQIPNYGNNGDFIDRGIYKLLYISKTEDKEIPAKIELNKIYYVGIKRVKILYYKKIDNEIYYTGYFGNLFLNSETFPNLEIDTSLDYNIIEQDEIFYYVIKIISTPNIITSTTDVPNSFIFDNYSDENYDYSMRVPGNGINGIGFNVYLKIVNRSDSKVVKNITNLQTISDSDIQILYVIVPTFSDEYILQLSAESKQEINFRIMAV